MKGETQMPLKTSETIKLEGKLWSSDDTTIIKVITSEIDNSGVARTWESIYNAEFYVRERREVRKMEREFADLVAEKEDAILSKLGINR